MSSCRASDPWDTGRSFAVTKPFFWPSKDVDGMYNYSYLLIVDYCVLKLAAAFSSSRMFIPWNWAVQRLSTGINSSYVLYSTKMLRLRVWNTWCYFFWVSTHPPDHSFSVNTSVCLSFLHSLVISNQVSITQASLSPVINTKVIFYLGLIWYVFLYNISGYVGDAVKK